MDSLRGYGYTEEDNIFNENPDAYSDFEMRKKAKYFRVLKKWFWTAEERGWVDEVIQSNLYRGTGYKRKEERALKRLRILFSMLHVLYNYYAYNNYKKTEDTIKQKLTPEGYTVLELWLRCRNLGACGVFLGKSRSTVYHMLRQVETLLLDSQQENIMASGKCLQSLRVLNGRLR
jgi:hypothetical protein